RAPGADDGPVLDGAGDAARLGLDAGEAGSGLVGREQPGLDVLVAELAPLVPAEDNHLADVVAPRDREEERGGDPVQLGAAGEDLVARERVRDDQWPARRHDASRAG